jgi:NAD(P)-dependent dehydrogenase (short-subunit alcohol dehydrogenase family)
MDRLRGKIAVITGANSGIGEASAKLFAREGATVVLVARRADKLKEIEDIIVAAGGKALSVPGDVTNEADCVNVFDTTVKNFKKVDVLVNCAGIVDNHTQIVKTSSELWDSIIKTNQTSVFLFCREALKHMGPAKSGAIVNVSSMAGVYDDGGFSYSASKTAIIGMSRNIAIRYARDGIRCNVICPGPTPTGLNTPEKMAKFDHEFMEICGRYQDPGVGESTVEDQANAILFFSNDESKCVTGQVLTIHRGWHL